MAVVLEVTPEEQPGGRGISALARNVRRARLARGLSLRALSTQTGVSKTLLSQIERMEANPTVAVVERLADEFGQTVTDLLRDVDQAPTVVRADRAGATTAIGVRTLFTSLDRRRFEITEGAVPARAASTKASHGAGSVEYAFVIEGDVEVHSNGWTVRLGPGDAIRFSGEYEHTYTAGATTVRLLTIIGYSED